MVLSLPKVPTSGMLPTPSTNHVSFSTIYEPAEDSYLLLDTLSSPTETAFLSARFNPPQSNSSPLILEVGTGSGVVLAFLTANAGVIFGRRNLLTLGTDVNRNACLASAETVRIAVIKGNEDRDAGNEGSNQGPGLHLDCLTADLCTTLRPGSVDVLVFNPPYVPTAELPRLPSAAEIADSSGIKKEESYGRDSALLSLSYAGGKDGMEITRRLLEDLPRVLSERGVAYILFCAQNKIEDVKMLVGSWGQGWGHEVVGKSGAKGGWERLTVARIWRRAVVVGKGGDSG
jgi:release factor glutamine methyltransferase